MKEFYFMVLPFALISSCAKVDVESYISEDAVKLSSAISALDTEFQTRVRQDYGLTHFPELSADEENIVLFMDVDNGEEGKKKTLLSDECGSLYYNDASEPYYYPETGTVSLYAFWPNKGFGRTGDPYPNEKDEYGKIWVTVDCGKNLEQYGDNTTLSNNDFMVAVKKGVSKSDERVKLSFWHICSNISVALKPGANCTADDLKNLKIKVSVPYSQINLNVDKAGLQDLSDKTKIKAVTNPTGTGATYTYSISTYITEGNGDDYAKYGRCIVRPRQTLSAGWKFITLYDENDNEITSYTLPAKLDLFGGEQYIYTITMNKSVSRSGLHNFSIETEDVKVRNWNTGEVL